MRARAASPTARWRLDEVLDAERVVVSRGVVPDPAAGAPLNAPSGHREMPLAEALTLALALALALTSRGGAHRATLTLALALALP